MNTGLILSCMLFIFQGTDDMETQVLAAVPWIACIERIGDQCHGMSCMT